MTDRRVIISVGIGERYEPYVRRLHRTVDQFWTGPTLFYEGIYPTGSPTHQESNYAFKAHAIREAIARGHTCLLYSDSCVTALANVWPIFDHIEKEGYLLIGDGHRLREWSSDMILHWAGLKREEIPPETTSAAGGFVGMDLEHPTGKMLYEAWTDAVEKKLTAVLWAEDPDGTRASSIAKGSNEFISSDPSVRGSMGDEAVLGALAYKHGLVAQEICNPWCAMSGESIFRATGYDAGEHGDLT